NPKSGQKGFAQMPHPPEEAADASERPPGTPRTAWNCLLPGQHVQGRFLRASKARYAGQAVELVAASGMSVRLTPNHPVLTAKGWIAAQAVKEGEHLVSYIGRLDDRAKAEQDGPAPADEVFRALQQLAGPVARRPARPEEF